jgi:exodeoxyribonuclease V alpha subunit
LNKAIQGIVNPHVEGERWKVGDRIICCKNFSKADMWNGDLGEVYDINMNGRPWVRLDRKDDQGCVIEIEISKEMERELKPAYCLSVHKAQGSQFRRVIFICLNKHRFMLSRSLIYTAVTRAKKGCCIVGEPEAFYRGINTIQSKKTILPLLAAGFGSNSIKADIEESIVTNDNGIEVPCIYATCTKCGHITMAYGNSNESIKAALAMLKEQCPDGENNFYVENN